MIEFIDVELSDELAERLRLVCRAAGDEPRDIVIAAAIDRYFHSEPNQALAFAEVVPMRRVFDERDDHT